MPTSFLVDGDRRILYRVRGNPGRDNEQTRTLIEKLIADTTNTIKLK